MVTVSTTEGLLEGEKLHNEYGGTYYSFKGIPYAEPPIGDLRFKAPQPPKPRKGIREAKKFGPQPYQYDFFIHNTLLGQEDCLYLNVYTPELQPFESLPVMVWIHGGGFTCGSGNDDVYGPEFLINKDVVLVTFNYRVGALGFLCLDTEDIAGNAGMKDQVAALRWVNKNIANFGGDPDNVTIFGESAGAASVSYHLISPMSVGLFKRAIIQSGAYTNWWAKCLNPRDRAINLAKRLGCYTKNDAELVHFFKSQPLESFQDTKLSITASEHFFECIDPDFTVVNEKRFGDNERFFYDDLTSCVHENVNIIIGYLEDEGILNLIPGTNKILDQVNLFSEFFVPKPLLYKSTLSEQLEIGTRIKEFYFGDDRISLQNIERLINFFSMYMFIYGTNVLARMIAAGKNNKVYLYKFGCKSKRNVFTKKFTGDLLKNKIYVCHADDIGYIFPMKVFEQNIDTNSREYHMIETVTKLWTNFAKFGCPTPDNSMGVEWQPYTIEKKNYININEKVTAGENPEEEEIIFWDKIYAHHFPQYAFHKI